MSISKETYHKILLVDDEESIHVLYKEFMELDRLLCFTPIIKESFGDSFINNFFTITSAFTGTEAIEMLHNDPSFACVVLDICMPGMMNGIDVLKIIKENWPNMPVMLHSAFQEFGQDMAIRASDAYIVKSSNLTDLIIGCVNLVKKNVNTMKSYD